MIYNLPNITYDSRSRVPEGYTELHWIESSGSQYLNTNWQPTNNVKGEVTYQRTSSAVDEQDIFGANGEWTGTSSDKYWGLFVSSSSSKLGVYNGADSGTQNIASSINTKYTATLQSVNGTTTLSQGTDAVTFSYTGGTNPSKSLYIFCRNKNGTANNFFTGRIYSAKFWDSTTLAFDGVPCINPQGEVGMYDTVSETFFGNSGSGVFIAGARVVQLPSGYTQLEYIQSDGSAYIDTGIKLNSTSQIDGVYTLETTQDGYGFGSYENGTLVLYCYGYNSKTAVCFGDRDGQSGMMSATSITLGQKILFNAYSGHQTISNGSTTLATATSTVSGTATINLYLFKANGLSQVSHNKTYHFNVRNGSTYQLIFIPCLNSSNEVGMYDLVSQSFFGNSGSGNFTAGEVV